jgi:hypothetical protein
VEVFLTLCAYVGFGRFGLCPVEEEDDHESTTLSVG